MAIITGVSALNVIAGFAAGLDAIMTCGTGTRSDIAVIKSGGCPGGSGMTVIAARGGDHMIWWLAGSHDAVMTTGAGSDNGDMVHPDHWLPGVCVMTVFAGFRCTYVLGRFGGRAYTAAPRMTG